MVATTTGREDKLPKKVLLIYYLCTRCSYFADTKLPLASEISTLRGHIFPLLGVYTPVVSKSYLVSP